MNKKDTSRYLKSHTPTYFNDISLKLCHKLLNLDYLHYGYFEHDTPHTLEGLKVAQEAYTQQIVAAIPQDVKNILDVGCGAGGNAKALVDKGYEVTCVEPDPYLIKITQQKTNDRIKTINSLYENVTNEQQQMTHGNTMNDLTANDTSSLGPKQQFNVFDLILMSESCQYICPSGGWDIHKQFLQSGGYVLAVDFFKIKPIDKSYLSKSGHELEFFLEQAKIKGFELVKQIDITGQTSPTMDIYQHVITEKIFPIFESLFEFINRKWPNVFKCGSFLFNNKLTYLKDKYSHQDARTFTEYKKYYMLLFRKI